MTPLALLSFSRYFPAALMVSPISLRPGRTLSLSEISKGKIREILVGAPRADVVAQRLTRNHICSLAKVMTDERVYEICCDRLDCDSDIPAGQVI
jgi:hypothetical protein